eukprot:gnl/MRDRNA2_/MRDRNA2_76015_c0_seq3.p1 gnl/MRDRNA2_/MRDRNA2_76015_c0~~gnl/MRDRNA2_/MRDRNA2_76015_c0_seq3.p1  ORF type:complete len:454 (+),score=76.73 gnl/MRDRNA2_/MRDRNA2_76015_c0_seq3:177-1538(+)
MPKASEDATESDLKLLKHLDVEALREKLHCTTVFEHAEILERGLRPFSELKFDYGRNTLAKEEKQKLKYLARVLNVCRVRVLCDGHTEKLGEVKGDDAPPKWLAHKFARQKSVEAAKIVRKALIKAGVLESRIDVGGHGAFWEKKTGIVRLVYLNPSDADLVLLESRSQKLSKYAALLDGSNRSMLASVWLAWKFIGKLKLKSKMPQAESEVMPVLLASGRIWLDGRGFVEYETLSVQERHAVQLQLESQGSTSPRNMILPNAARPPSPSSPRDTESMSTLHRREATQGTQSSSLSAPLAQTRSDRANRNEPRTQRSGFPAAPHAGYDKWSSSQNRPGSRDTSPDDAVKENEFQETMAIMSRRLDDLYVQPSKILSWDASKQPSPSDSDSSFCSIFSGCKAWYEKIRSGCCCAASNHAIMESPHDASEDMWRFEDASVRIPNESDDWSRTRVG